MARLSGFQFLQPSLGLALLVLIIIAALALRLNGLNWDNGYGFHPDERSLYMRADCMYNLLTTDSGEQPCLTERPLIETGFPGFRTLLDFERSPLNPHWFPLGSVLIYVLVVCRFAIEMFTDVGGLDMRYVGRTLSALADVGSVILVYLLGRRIYWRGYGPWVGLLAAALVAFAVIHIQNSHYFRPETFSAFWILAVFWAILNVIEKRRLRDTLLLGALTGMAIAPKVSVLPLLLPLGLCFYYRMTAMNNGRLSGLPRGEFEQNFLHAVAGGATALAAFFLVTPYGLLNLSNFLAELLAQTEMARQAGLWPFTIQYVGTPSFWYQFQQTAIWGFGPPLGLVAWLSIPFTALLVWKGTFARREDILLLAWLIPSILLLESFEVRFQRYYFALIPFMVLLGSRMLLWAPFQLRTSLPTQPGAASIVHALQGNARWLGMLSSHLTSLWNRPACRQWLLVGAWAVVGIVLLSTVFYGLAFQRVYMNPHTAVAASQWINENLPSGTPIVSDNHWDEFVPQLYDYQVWQFPAYEPDNGEKMAELAARLAESEYLVFYSHRPYVSVASDPQRFPASGEYYRQLFGGELGYRLERSFASYPSLMGISIAHDHFARTDFPRPAPPAADAPSGVTLNWGYADDNVAGYDHPTVLLFRNAERLPAERLTAQLAAGHSPELGALRFSPEDWERQQSGGTWSAIFDRDSLANRWQALAWLLVIEALFIVALPISLVLFRPLADRGIVLAKVVGLFTVALLTWLAVSFGWMEFSNRSILASIGVLAALSALAVATQWRWMWPFVRERWRLLVTAEAIFLVAFFAFVVIRSLNPDLWHPLRGGEKPMELAYFNAVIKSSLLPPYNPWFAGGYLNYYYWGYFILAIPTRLSGILPTVAFNLAVPLLFALTVTGAYSVVYNLAEGFRRSRRPQRSQLTEAGAVEADSAYAGDFPANPTHGASVVGRLLRSPMTAGGTAAAFVAVIGNLDGAVQWGQGLWGRLTGTLEMAPQFDFWRSSRMIPNSEGVEPNLWTFWLWGTGDAWREVGWHITEFPFFTFLFADLHAHMMAIPFTILVVALALNLAAGFRRLGVGWDLLAATALGICVGSMWLINSWDYPSLLVLALATASFAVLQGAGSRKHRITWAVALSAWVWLVSVVVFLPFRQVVETSDVGLRVTLWSTPLTSFEGIHGLFLLITGVFLVWQARRPLYLIVGRVPYVKYFDMAVETTYLQRRFTPWLRVWVLAGLLLALLFFMAGYPVAGVGIVFLALAGLVAWDAIASGERGLIYRVFPLALAGLAFGLVVGVELVRVGEDIGRMNTLFKYYLEVWILLAMASAWFLWRMWYDNRFRPFPFDRARLAWLGLVTLLVVGSLIYTVLGTQARLADRFNPLPPTLDGAAYMAEASHWEKDQLFELKHDLEAIRWLQDNVIGSPVVLEAHTDQYRWGSRIAVYTGLPTVLGWPWHQVQQRGPYRSEVYDRAADIATIYNTEDLSLAQSLLKRYGVEYVVVGELERIHYPGDGVGKFATLATQGAADLVFDNGSTAVYRLRE